MFLGCGVGAFSAGVFHVMTHAFFKALLFLGAGSVIHGMHEEQNILKMGGLRKYMPQTFIVFTIAWLAICGIPPFSGFFSKDEILWMTFSGEHGSKILWFVGALTAGMTAFYMTRLYLLTFFGKERFDHHHVHPHESPLIMILPLAVLALLSAVGGFLGIPHHSFLEHWLEPVLHYAGGAGETLVEASHSLEYVLMVVSVGIGLLGIFSAWKIYGEQKNKADELKNRFIQLHRGSENKWYIDEIYEAIFVKPIHQLSLFLWKFVDVLIIDGAVLGFTKASDFSGKQLRKIQTGSIQNYTGMLVIALAIIAVITLCWVIKAAGVV
jgi:NADH-quinone oxidoreductase subunit L